MLHLLAGIFGFAQAVLTRWGQLHGVLASVLRAAAARDEPLLLQSIDECHHRRAVDTEPARCFQLGQRVFRRENDQDRQLAAGVLLLAGCSPGSSAGGATASASAGGSAAIAQYPACLKSHGVTLPSGGFGRTTGRASLRQVRRAPEWSAEWWLRWRWTWRRCLRQSLRGGGRAGLRASLRPTGQGGSCMKDNGVTVTAQQVRSITSSTDPKTVSALKVCKPLLPTGGASTAPTATPSS